MSVAEPLVQASLLGEAIDPGPVPVLVADEEGRYVAVNEYACRLLGYTREELLRLNVADVARDGKQAYDEMLRLSHWEGIAALTRKDGSPVALRWWAREKRVAGMALYVAIGFPATE